MRAAGPAEDLLITRVDSVTSGEGGRSLNRARNHHFVIDEPAHGGGPGEEITPGESFLAGISACGVLLVEHHAQTIGVALHRAEATIEGERLRADTSWFRRIVLRFRLIGPSQEDAEALVEHYKGH